MAFNKDKVVEARNLSKTYVSRAVVSNASFSVYEGECFGLLGPNGAGKTSLMRILYGSSPSFEGDLFILNQNAKKQARGIKNVIGVVPQEDGLDTDFSVFDNLMVFLRYYSITGSKAKSKAREVLNLLQLDHCSQQAVGTLSGGMRKRLAIARALINDPKILFLDEPTTGLDPQARLWVWNMIEKLKSKGVTIVLTTHFMEEAETLCDRIVIMDKSRILNEGTPKELINKFVGKEVVEFKVDATDIDYYINKIKNDFAYQILSEKMRIFIRSGQDSRVALNLISGPNILIRKASLDDVFLKVAGYEIREFQL